MEETPRLKDLARAVAARVPVDAAHLLERETPEVVAAVLQELPQRLARNIVEHLPQHLRPLDPMAITTELQIPGTVADLMEPVYGRLPETATVQDAIQFLRAASNSRQITYLYTVDGDDRLTGLVVIRDLLLSNPDQPLSEVALPDPFALDVDMPAGEAIKAAVHRHYPVYPVVDGRGAVVGVVRGWRLFERQAIEITAQSGQMVGVNKEERVYTGITTAFQMRHPWLLINLLTAFGTAFVVATFEGTIEKIVVLAAFLPVLSCLAGNTGCQSLAITLRGLTLGDLPGYSVWRLLRKEVMMGALNGFFTGILAGAVIYVFAWNNGDGNPLLLALLMVISMVGACVISCLLGMLVPLALRRAGADPATASSIFVLTITDIMGMGLMLGLATAMLL
jgi:magnesium transporter